MNLAFYYHIGLDEDRGTLRVPGYLGVFIDALAAEVESVTLFMHRAEGAERAGCDYALQKANLRWEDLGRKKRAWHRFLWPSATLKGLGGRLASCEALLVRAPSPLAPAFQALFGNQTTVAYLVVGDYRQGVRYLNQPWWRRLPIVWLSKRNDRQLTKALSKSVAMVNSTALFRRYEACVPRLYEVRTTTLSAGDIWRREDTCGGDEIRLLFTGRIDLAKGLRELVDATARLQSHDKVITLHLAGWEENPDRPIERLLRDRAEALRIADRVVFHGRKTVGPDLHAVYRMADIYVIASYHEGFPRTIWEAMANGLPVIASGVGSIPANLRHGQDAILIDRQNVPDIVHAVETLIADRELRRGLIRRGLELAEFNTLEAQTKVIVSILKRSAVA